MSNGKKEQAEDLSMFDAAVKSAPPEPNSAKAGVEAGADDVGAIFDNAANPQGDNLGLADIPKIAAAPIIATSQMFNPIAAAMRATYDSYKNGTPFADAYKENMSNIRAAQDQILESSSMAKAFGQVGSFGAAVALPGTKAVGATLGALESARGSVDLEDTLKKAAVGGAAGFAFGAMGQKVAKSIPSAQRMKSVIAPKKATETFNASSNNLKNYLKSVEGDTLSEKMTNFGDFLFKKSVIGNKKAIDQVERQAENMGNKISESISRMKAIALKENPNVDTTKIYEEIKDNIINLQPDEKIKRVVDTLFGDLNTEQGFLSMGKKGLKDLEKIVNKVKTKANPLYRKPYDRLNPVEKDVVDAFDILRESFNDAVEKTIVEKIPQKAGEYARLRTDGHMIFQLKRFAQDRAAELSSKRQDDKFASGGLIQTVINKAGKALTPSPERLRSGAFPNVVGAGRDMMSRGQKVPFLMGRDEQK